MRIHLETRKARKAGAPRVASETPELDEYRASRSLRPRRLLWRRSGSRRRTWTFAPRGIGRSGATLAGTGAERRDITRCSFAAGSL